MACVRLKRYLTKEPVEAVVVSHKRRRVDGKESDVDEVQTIFRYAGTVLSKDESVTETLSKAVHLDKYKLSSRKRVKACTAASKLKEDGRNISKENRYKLVSTRRGMLEKSLLDSQDDEKNASLQEEADPDYCKLYDIEQYTNLTHMSKEEQVITCNGEPMTLVVCDAGSTSEPRYVYDLYYVDSDNVQGFPEEPLRIEFWDAVTEQLYDADDSDIDEDDDSNDENYWANDYPDEDSDYERDLGCYQEDEDDITGHFTTMRLGTDLPSDRSSNDEYDPDSDDERMHGRTYATYKKRMLKYMKDDEREESDENDESINNDI